MPELEAIRISELKNAQDKAENLFRQIGERGLVRPQIRESQLNDEIYQLAEQMYGITKYWHKRIVRSGSNTLLPYAENPLDQLIGKDDILFLDFGPIFDQWEADFGRTYVIGEDPLKHRLRLDTERAFADGKRYFEANPSLTASELFEYVSQMARNSGWEFGGPMAGHLIGQFPHERIPEDKISLYIHPKNQSKIRSRSEDGQLRHWILEIHFVDRQNQIGAFFEELLTI
jgi:Xaa-Pro dipeptidase